MVEMSFATLAVHAGEEADPSTGALTPGIHMSSAFQLPGFGPSLFQTLAMESAPPRFAYARWGNPTTSALERKVAALEQGESAVALASGMAAVSALLLTLLGAGDHVIASEACYAGSVELFGLHLPRLGIQVSLVDTSQPDQVLSSLRPNTRLLFIETPANPILRLADIDTLANIAHKAGVPLAVDSTWASPCLQRPLALGADYVVHSATKYLNGHGDALGGIIVGAEQGIHRIRRDALVHYGGALSPFNAWLILRGLVTLPIRMARHSESALEMARFLETHPAVSRVVYPGLESHPQHDLASRQMAAFGGMLTLQLRQGLRGAITLSEKVRLFAYATSLGHARSLMFYYPTDLYFESAPYLTAAQKRSIRGWVGDGIVRLSIGLEDVEDLKADLDQALRSRTAKGLVGPAAYAALKRLQRGAADPNQDGQAE